MAPLQRKSPSYGGIQLIVARCRISDIADLALLNVDDLPKQKSLQVSATSLIEAAKVESRQTL
jgi:hypothetical protein